MLFFGCIAKAMCSRDLTAPEDKAILLHLGLGHIFRVWVIFKIYRDRS